jgi:hypothetical protein
VHDWGSTVCTVGNLPESAGGLRTELDPDAIINRRTDPLLAAQIALGSMNWHMTQKELDLLQLTSRCLSRCLQVIPERRQIMSLVMAENSQLLHATNIESMPND